MPNRFSDKMFGPAKQMAKAGRFGDTILAHINPQEAALLKARGGSGTVNPMTGAMEFATREEFDPEFYLANNPDVAAAGYGTGEGQIDPFEHYDTFINKGNETRAANFDERQEQDLGAFTGVFDSDYYLSQNQDVADALSGGLLGDITTARGHFDVFGQTEKRTGNQTQQDLKDAGYTGTFGGGMYGGQSQFATERAGLFDSNPNLLNEAGTNLSANIMGSGEGAFDLIGNTSTTLNPDLLDTLDDRFLATETGYTGGFQPGTVDAFRGDYTDMDDDPKTRFTAANTSNISRAGTDIAPQRDAVRSIGYEGEFGLGGAGEYVTEQLGEYGLATTGNVQNDAALIKNAQENEALQTQLTEALTALQNVTAAVPEPSNTLNLTTPPAPVNTEPSTDVSTAIPTPTMPFVTPSPAAPAPSVQSAPSFMNNFRGTRINPFTGALEYLPARVNPSAFSQTVLNPRFSGGFGTNIRL